MELKRELFSVSTTIVIALLLAVPFIIRTLAPALEPHPAVLLPLGIGMLDIDDNVITYSVTKVQGVDEMGNWVRLSPREIIFPAHDWYFVPLMNHDFGLKNHRTRNVKSAIWGFIDIPVKQINEAQMIESQQWFKERLIQLWVQPDSFRVAEYEIKHHITLNKELSRECVSEKMYRLD